MLVAIPAPSTHLQWLQKRLGTSPTLPPLPTVYRVQIPTLYATTPFGPVFAALHIPAFQAISPCKYAVLHQSFDEYGYTKARQRLDSTRSSHPRVVSVPLGPDSSHIGDHHSEAFYNATPWFLQRCSMNADPPHAPQARQSRCTQRVFASLENRFELVFWYRPTWGNSNTDDPESSQSEASLQLLQTGFVLWKAKCYDTFA